MKTWRYFVGDIHGCYETYLVLEQKIQKHANKHGVKPLIVSLGDLIDRGPCSKEVVEHFMQGEEEGTHCAVIGNHDALLLKVVYDCCPWSSRWGKLPPFLASIVQDHDDKKAYSQFLTMDDYRHFIRCFWLAQGGFQTLESYGFDPFEPRTWKLPKNHVQYLLSLPPLLIFPKAIASHALLTKKDLKRYKELNKEEKLTKEEQKEFRKLGHSLLWSRVRPTTRPHPKKVHISGHTPFRKVLRFGELGFLQVDTSCVYGHRLSAWCDGDDSILSTKKIDETSF